MSPPKESRPDNYEMNAKICRLVEQCPFMYDRSHPQYLRKEICDEAWIRIAKEMGESVFPCRERWRNIRTSFARSINTNKIPSSANRTKPYYLHEELKFLARHITPGVPVRNKRRATSGSGEESEHIEISVGEETFNGFERLSATGGESTDATQNGHESNWQRLQQQIPQHLNQTDNGGVGGLCGVGNEEHSIRVGNDSCHSSINGGTNSRREDESSCRRFSRLPPPPLQAAPHSTLQRDCDETEAVSAIQQIHMHSNQNTSCPPLSKRPCKESETAAADDIRDVAHDRQRQQTNMDSAFLEEFKSEFVALNEREKIHLKRRIYEALSEIRPLESSPDGAESKSSITTDSTISQLTLLTLMRVENLVRDLKSDVANSNGIPAASVPFMTVMPNGPTARRVESPISNSAAVAQTQAQAQGQPPLIVPQQKRNGFGMRTRSRPNDRHKTGTTGVNGNTGTSVKDEPETFNQI